MKYAFQTTKNERCPSTQIGLLFSFCKYLLGRPKLTWVCFCMKQQVLDRCFNFMQKWTKLIFFFFKKSSFCRFIKIYINYINAVCINLNFSAHISFFNLDKLNHTLEYCSIKQKNLVSNCILILSNWFCAMVKAHKNS